MVNHTDTNEETIIQNAYVYSHEARKRGRAVTDKDQIRTIELSNIILQHRGANAISLETFIDPYINQDSPEVLIRKPSLATWKPGDFLPNSMKTEYFDGIREIQEDAKNIPTEILAVLVAHTIVEESLPNYESALVKLTGIADISGSDETNWAKWTRWWTAEESIHGTVMDRYLEYSSRINMDSVVLTRRNLVAEGFNPGVALDPYKGFFYTAFQEKATQVAHARTGIAAKEYGAIRLQQICAQISKDEARHKKFYQLVAKKLFEIDPDGAMVAFNQMFKTVATMPGVTMSDGETPNLYKTFEAFSIKEKIYTPIDYVKINNAIVDDFDIANTTFTSIPAQIAQAQTMQRYENGMGKAERAVAIYAKRESKIMPAANLPWFLTN